MISVILPTYNEVENITKIVPIINDLFSNQKIKGEIIVVDDNSHDGTADAVKCILKQYPVKVYVRKTDRGLSKSVIKGFGLARNDICVVMDADFSHPIECIADLVRPIINGECDMTVGSRYMAGGGRSDWPLLRQFISKAACFMAKGLTSLSDPTSGFMAIRKSILNNVDIDPIGWKIALEIAVKVQPKIKEIPIIFSERKLGKSKLGINTQIVYLQHLLKLYSFKYFKKIFLKKRKC